MELRRKRVYKKKNSLPEIWNDKKLIIQDFPKTPVRENGQA